MNGNEISMMSLLKKGCFQTFHLLKFYCSRDSMLKSQKGGIDLCSSNLFLFQVLRTSPTSSGGKERVPSSIQGETSKSIWLWPKPWGCALPIFSKLTFTQTSSPAIWIYLLGQGQRSSLPKQVNVRFHTGPLRKEMNFRSRTCTFGRSIPPGLPVH